LRLCHSGGKLFAGDLKVRLAMVRGSLVSLPGRSA
jgi:hypothetical protein